MNRRVIAAVDDLFFESKIRATVQSLDVEVRFSRGIDQLLTAAMEEKPDLIVVDLHNQRIDPIALAHRLKTNDDLRSVLLVGFFSHVETELQRAASEAGYDKVIPRSVFSRDLASILEGKSNP